MVTTLNDTKRLAIAERLADLKAFQNLIISNEQKLIDACPYDDIRDRLQNMLADDRKNIGIIDTAIVQYGIQSELSAATKIFTAICKFIEYNNSSWQTSCVNAWD